MPGVDLDGLSEVDLFGYTDSLDGISAGSLQGFFEGWPDPPDAHTHLQLLQKSDAVVLALEDRTKRVIGFITAISDDLR